MKPQHGNWNRSMTQDQILRLMTDDEVRDGARRGGPACIKEKIRRDAANKATSAQEFQRSTGLFLTQAEALRNRRPATPFERQEAELDQEAERLKAAGISGRDMIFPDPELDIGV
jgi:hypothetical protein